MEKDRKEQRVEGIEKRKKPRSKNKGNQKQDKNKERMKKNRTGKDRRLKELIRGRNKGVKVKQGDKRRKRRNVRMNEGTKIRCKKEEKK